MKNRMKISLFLFTLTLYLVACQDKIPILEVIQPTEDNYDLQIFNKEDIDLKNPAGICFHKEAIYICDSEQNCIIKVSTDLQYLDSYGTLGMEDGNFSKPMDICFDNGFFYVLDSKNNRIQKFTEDFTYVQSVQLETLISAQGLGQYISLAVFDNRIYVSVFAAEQSDAYIYYYNGEKWNKLADKAIGYLCKGREKVYFVNMMEAKPESKESGFSTGANSFYEIVEDKVSEVKRIPDSYTPTALSYDQENLYLISAGTGFIYRYAIGLDEMEKMITLPNFGLIMYSCVDSEGKIYISDNDHGDFYICQ
jgi:hypothetical protein